MAKEINLLPQQIHTSDQTNLTIWSMRIGGVCVALFIVTVLVLIIGNIYISKEISTIDVRIEDAKQTIKSKQEEEELYIAFANKLQTISSVVQGRFPYSHFLTSLKQIVGDDVRLDTIAISTSGEIKLKIYTLSALSFNTFTNDIVKSSIAQPYVITANSTTRNSDGSYILLLSFSKPVKPTAIPTKTSNTGGL